MSQAPANRMAAIKDDGFIDFYELLGVETDATTTRIRTTINTLYNEAQSNRDHRNLNRRREYQTLLQILPQARDLLLEDKRRERYDAYRSQVQSGSAAISFDDWARNLREEEEAAKGETAAVLGIQDEQGQAAAVEGDGVPRATVIKQPAKKNSRVTIGDSVAPSSNSAARQSLIGSAISIIVFFVAMLIVYAVSNDLAISILVGAIGGIVTWLITHRKTPNRTSL